MTVGRIRCERRGGKNSQVIFLSLSIHRYICGNESFLHTSAHTHTGTHTQLTDIAVFPLPARLTDAGPVVALAMFLAAWMACSLVARGASPALLTLTLALWASTMAATWHRAQLCQTGRKKRSEERHNERVLGKTLRICFKSEEEKW